MNATFRIVQPIPGGYRHHSWNGRSSRSGGTHVTTHSDIMVIYEKQRDVVSINLAATGIELVRAQEVYG